jgi:hypothetical protein
MEKIAAAFVILKTVVQQFFFKNKPAVYFVAGGCVVYLLMAEKEKLTEASHQKDLQHLQEKAVLQNQVQHLKDKIKSDSAENYFTALMLNNNQRHQIELLDLKNEVAPLKRTQELIAEINKYSHIDGTHHYPDDINYTAQEARKRALIQQLNILLKETGQEQKYKYLIRSFYTVPAFNTTYPNITISDKYPELFNTTASKK